MKQVLQQHGALPIGEIGKQLQIKTGNSGTLKCISVLCNKNIVVLKDVVIVINLCSSNDKNYRSG